MFVLILLSTILFLCFIHVLLNYNERARTIKKIPGPKDAFIVGNALEILVSPDTSVFSLFMRQACANKTVVKHARVVGALMKLGRIFASKWKGICRFWAFPFGAVNIYNPEDIETVISTTKFNEKSLIYKFLHPWLRNGLLVSNGETWQQRRKLLTPAFHFNILRKFFVILKENSQRLVDGLSKQTDDVIDVVPVLSEFTLHSICETAMGTQLSKETSNESRSYKQAILDLVALLLQRFTRIYLYPDIVFKLSPEGRKTHKYLDIVHKFTKKVIAERREYVDKYGVTFSDAADDEDDVYKKKRKTAMLDLLLLAEKDKSIDDAGIQEEVDTFMFEGHDTTASGLTFSLLEIANNKDVQDKIYKEQQDIFGDSTREPTMEDLTKMKYLDCCIKESLRLYPPVHFISRNIHEPVILSGYKVPAGTFCHIFIFDLHRNPQIYENPSLFDPDRFLPENSQNRHPYAYIPFSAGPRNCIGQKFAMMEMKLAISGIIRKLELTPVTRPEDINFTADLVLRSSKPIYISFKPRIVAN